MIPAKFDYTKPGSLDEAVRALADGGEDAKVIAGGQSLLPLLRLRLSFPDLLVDVAGSGNCAASATRAKRCGSARSPPLTRRSATRSSPSIAGCSPRRPP